MPGTVPSPGLDRVMPAVTSVVLVTCRPRSRALSARRMMGQVAATAGVTRHHQDRLADGIA